MTYNELYRQTKNSLKKAGLESPAFDAMCLFEKVCNMDRHSLIMNGNNTADEKQVKILENFAKRRIEKEPLQYILGKWDFMDSEFFVGDGVLIPREDTQSVVQLCADNIIEKFGTNAKIRILDLCAGSGTIGITLGKTFINSEVIAIEKSEKAFDYLTKNIAHNKTDNVKAIKGDIFTDYTKFDSNSIDVIISNPPYIIKDVIATLQTEVQKEPFMALNGGADGYDFYKAIVNLWLPILKSGSIITFELGENQFNTIKTMLLEKGCTNIKEALDFGNIQRGISAIKN